MKTDEVEKKKAEELRQIIIPMIVFMLEHQRLKEEGRREDSERYLDKEKE